MAETHECENVTVKRETTDALLVELEDGTTKWIPKSAIADESEVYEMGTEGTLIIAQWLAEKEGLV